MASKLTQQQRVDLHASHKRLQALTQLGINARHIPAEQVESELQNYAATLARMKF